MKQDVSAGTPAGSAARLDARPAGRLGIAPVFAGIVTGVDNVGITIALATLMFAGPLSGGLGMAASAALLATAIMAFALSAGSGLRGNLGQVQDIGVAVLAPALAAMAMTSALAPEALVATAFAIVAASSLATGALMFLVGRLGLGSMVRFFPQTVIAGFLAGTGWLLVVGGVAVAASLPMEDLFEPAAWSGEGLARVAPAMAFALALWIILPRVAHPAALVVVLLAAVAGFHGLLRMAGMDVATAQGWGWLPAAPATGSLAELPRLLPLVDWSVVTAALPVVGIVAVLNLLACLMNTTALEAVTGKDADQNAELRVTGLANIACGLAAGPSGYSGLASSLIAHRIAPGSRMAGALTGAVALLGIVAADALVASIPTFVTAGLTVYLGADLLRHWLIDTRRRYSPAEWATVLLIVIAVAAVGFAAAVVLGLAIALVLFVFSYARVPVVQRMETLDQLHSTLERDPVQAAVLRGTGNQVAVYELQGFLFFGTAERLRTQLKARLTDAGQPVLRRLIIDFGQVSGVDSAALAVVERIGAMTGDRRIELVLSRLRRDFSEALERAAPTLVAASHVHLVKSLDQAVETAEEMLLGNVSRSVNASEIAARYAPLESEAAPLAEYFSRLPAERLERGARIMAQGEPADGLVLLEEGRVAVWRKGAGAKPPQRLRAMSAGSIVGDIGFANGGARTADIVAETDVVLRRITHESLVLLEEEDPVLALAVARVVMRALAEKVITANRAAQSQRS